MIIRAGPIRSGTIVRWHRLPPSGLAPYFTLFATGRFDRARLPVRDAYASGSGGATLAKSVGARQ